MTTTRRGERAYSIQIVEMDEAADVFRTLGGWAWPTARDRNAAWQQIPVGADESSLIVDLVADNGTILAEKHISEETALRMLGVDDLQPLRDEFDRDLAAQIARWEGSEG